MEQIGNKSKHVDKYDAENTFVTHIKLKEYNYTWIIKNFSSYELIDKKCALETCNFLTFFKNEYYKWSITLHINGINEDFLDYLSLQVFLFDSYQIHLFKKVLIKISLVNREGKEVNVQQSVCHNVPEEDDNLCFFDKFIRRSYVLDKNNGLLLPNDQLTIRCKLSFHEGIEEYSGSTAYAIKEISSEYPFGEFGNFKQLLKSEKFTDVKLVVGDKEFRVHKCVLSTRSPVFSDMFEQQEKSSDSIEITDVSYDVMKAVLHFIYSGKVNNVKDICHEILVAAIKYQLEGLKILCEELLIAGLAVENIYQSLILVDKYNLEKLKAATMKFLTTHLKDLAVAKNFLKTVQSISPSFLADVINALTLK